MVDLAQAIRLNLARRLQLMSHAAWRSGSILPGPSMHSVIAGTYNSILLLLLATCAMELQTWSRSISVESCTRVGQRLSFESFFRG
jgi:hypothetical protein